MVLKRGGFSAKPDSTRFGSRQHYTAARCRGYFNRGSHRQINTLKKDELYDIGKMQILGSQTCTKGAQEECDLDVDQAGIRHEF